MQKQLEKLVAADGVLAAAMFHEDGFLQLAMTEKSHFSKERWTDVLGAAANLLRRTTDDSIRIISADYTLTVRLQMPGVGVDLPSGVLCVASIVGHPVAKSLKRMMIRTMRGTRRPEPPPATASL